jgi:hypothetical protein
MPPCAQEDYGSLGHARREFERRKAAWASLASWTTASHSWLHSSVLELDAEAIKAQVCVWTIGAEWGAVARRRLLAKHWHMRTLASAHANTFYQGNHLAWQYNIYQERAPVKPNIPVMRVLRRTDSARALKNVLRAGSKV